MKKINIILKYPNSHLLPIIDELNKYPYQNKVYYLAEIHNERKGYDWEIPSTIKAKKIKWTKDLIPILESEVLISWGIWMDWRFCLLIFIASHFKKKIFIFSESENIYRFKKSHLILKYLTSFFINKKRIYYLTMGGYEYVKRDFSKYGFKIDNFLPFGFSGAIQNTQKEKLNYPNLKETNKLQFLFVGQLIHRKGLDILFEALTILNKDDFTLKIAGVGNEKSNLKNLAEKLGIHNNVEFLGLKTKSKLKELYFSSDVFILPSRFDGWGAVLNEAASFSLPLIVSKMVRGGEEMIKTFENGFVFKDKEELKRILSFVNENRFLLKKFGENSLEISKSYSPFSLAAKLDNYIQINSK